MNTSNVKRLTTCSIFLAILVLLEYIDSLLPVNQVFVLAFCGAIVWFIIQKYDVQTGAIFYVAGCSLLLIVLPDKKNAIMFTLFFGLYSVIKYYINSIKPSWLSWVVKIFTMNVMAAILFLSFIALFTNSVCEIIAKSPTYLIITVIIAFQVIIIVYDYSLTIIIRYIGKLIKQTR